MKVLRRYRNTQHAYPMAIVEVGDWLLYLVYRYSSLSYPETITVDVGRGVRCQHKKRCELETYHYVHPFPRRIELPLAGDPDDTFRKFLDGGIEAHLVEAVL